MNSEAIFNLTRKAELETQLIINKNLYDMKIIDYNTYQNFVNHILTKLQQIRVTQ